MFIGLLCVTKRSFLKQRPWHNNYNNISNNNFYTKPETKQPNSSTGIKPK